jgi:hypothetical protein
MSRAGLYSESHLVNRIGWLRAAVLGANDGIVSTASLSGSLLPPPNLRIFSSQELPGSLRARCRWLPANTYR